MTSIKDLRFDKKPEVARLSNRMNTICKTIQECILDRRLYPTLILIYSSIDILGALQTPDGFSTGTSFKTWAKTYFLTEGSFSFDENDLYGARCAIVHTLRYDSNSRNPIKSLVYGFHGYDDDIQKIKNPTQYVGVYIEDLSDALLKSYQKYLTFLQNTSNADINMNLKRLPKYVDLIALD